MKELPEGPFVLLSHPDLKKHLRSLCPLINATACDNLASEKPGFEFFTFFNSDKQAKRICFCCLGGSEEEWLGEALNI